MSPPAKVPLSEPAPLCGCGCGGRVTGFVPRGAKKGWNLFLHGHHIRTKNPNRGHLLGPSNPMNDPKVRAKLAGKNHWTARPENAERAKRWKRERSRESRGEKNPMWKGGVTPKKRMTPEQFSRRHSKRMSGAGNPNYIDGRSKSPIGFYRQVRVNGHTEKAHRVIMAAVLERPLRKGEVVHHRDEDPKNNKVSNLHLFHCQACHIHYHRKRPKLAYRYPAVHKAKT